MTTVAIPHLERYMPLAEAARRFGMSQIALRRLVDTGRIRAVELPSGEVGVSENGIKAVKLERFIPISEAAERLDITQGQLQSLIEQSVVSAAELPNGDIGVSESTMLSAVNERLKSIHRGDFKYLAGQPITISQAEEQYEIPGTTLRDWIRRDHIRVLDKKRYPVEVDEADVDFLCCHLQDTQGI